MSCYPDEVASFPMELKKLLQTHSSLLHPDVRMVRVLLLEFLSQLIKIGFPVV